MSSRIFQYVRNAISGDEDNPSTDELEVRPPGFNAPSVPEPPSLSQTQLGEDDNDTFVRSVQLCLNGRVLQSLTMKDADLRQGSPEAYFLFNKVEHHLII